MTEADSDLHPKPLTRGADGRKPRFRAWIGKEWESGIDTLRLRLGARAGGVVLSRDQVINVLIRDGLEMHLSPTKSQKDNAKQKVRHAPSKKSGIPAE